MSLIALEEILSNFPVILVVWTAFTLCWGIYINVAFSKMLSKPCAYHGVVHTVDSTNVKFVLGGNFVLALYLVLQPLAAEYIGDSIVIVNIFFSVYLATASFKVGSWWKHTCQQYVDGN